MPPFDWEPGQINTELVSTVLHFMELLFCKCATMLEAIISWSERELGEQGYCAVADCS